ncbi:MAG: hypothetical protein AB7F32_05355 [Victivallaceae bacterium]
MIKYAIASAAALLFAAGILPAATVELGNGFRDHGITAPVSSVRGLVTVANERGEAQLLAQLLDVRGAYGMLQVNLENGESHFSPLPVKPDFIKSVFSAMASRQNRFYAQHSGNFFEYDPVAGKYTFAAPVKSGDMAMSMTEDDRGLIWSVSYPGCGLTSFDPRSRELKDYGLPFAEKFSQYGRSIAADDRGWIYIGYGNAAGQIVGIHPDTGEKIAVLKEAERPAPGAGLVFRGEDGCVYGTFGAAVQYRNARDFRQQMNGSRWFRLHDGKVEPLAGKPAIEAADIRTGTQDFADLRDHAGRLIEADIPGRKIRITDRDGRVRELAIDYPSSGSHQISIAALGNGVISGGTSFPMSNFVYDPRSDRMLHRNGAVQWNVVLPYQNHLFIAAYLGGYLLDWQTDLPYEMPLRADDATGNPKLLAPPAKPHIGRPDALAISPDGRYLLMGGTPGYGLTGGGLAIFDRREEKMTVIPHTRLIADQAVHALAVTADNRVFGGTTINAGTGGKEKAKAAELFEFDLASGKIIWREALNPVARTCYTLLPAADGSLIGVADGTRLFRFDPATRQITNRIDLKPFGPVVYQQGPRSLLPDGKWVYLLCRDRILKLDSTNFTVSEMVKTPVPIEVGGALLDGRIYFGGEGRLYSWELPPVQ